MDEDQREETPISKDQQFALLLMRLVLEEEEGRSRILEFHDRPKEEGY